MSINEFIKSRERIEALLAETSKWVRQKSVYESSIRLEELRHLLIDLNCLVTNDVQKKAVIRIKGEIEFLDTEIEEIQSRRDIGKKQDGNLAFKCNWNDQRYKAPCNETAYNTNLIEGRAWCSHPTNKCRTFTDIVTIENNPCYESIALREMYFGAGWDLSGNVIKYRHIHSVRKNRLAVLTTRRPSTPEKDRIIIGCLHIDKVIDDPGAETKIFGHKKTSFEIDYDNIHVLFWDYYRNTDSHDSIFWGTGLFRYLSNVTVLHILRDIKDKFELAGIDTDNVAYLEKEYTHLTTA